MRLLKIFAVLLGTLVVPLDSAVNIDFPSITAQFQRDDGFFRPSPLPSGPSSSSGPNESGRSFECASQR